MPTRNSLHLDQDSTLVGFAGVVILLASAHGLGLPVEGGAYGYDILGVITGFYIARIIRRQARKPKSQSSEHIPQHDYNTYLIAHLYVPTLVLAALALIYYVFGQGQLTGLSPEQILTLIASLLMVLNLLQPFLSVFEQLAHLWLISLVFQFTLIAPILVLAMRSKLNRYHRAAGLVGLAAAFVLIRTVFFVTEIGDPVTILGFTRFDGLLTGLAIGIVPSTVFYRRPATIFLIPAYLTLLITVLAPFNRLFTSMGVGAIHIPQYSFLSPLVVLSTAVILWGDIGGLTPQPIRSQLQKPSIRWYGIRAVGIYLWHLPFRYLLTDQIAGHDPTWPGYVPVVSAATLTLAAAAITHRTIEDPLKQLITFGPSGPPPPAPRIAVATPMQRIRRAPQINCEAELLNQRLQQPQPNPNRTGSNQTVQTTGPKKPEQKPEQKKEPKKTELEPLPNSISVLQRVILDTQPLPPPDEQSQESNPNESGNSQRAPNGNEPIIDLREPNGNEPIIDLREPNGNEPIIDLREPEAPAPPPPLNRQQRQQRSELGSS